MGRDGPIQLATAAMGTRFELVLPRCAMNPGERDLRAAGEAAIGVIEDAHRRYSAKSRDGIVAVINRDAATRPVDVDGETMELLAVASEVWRESGGAFDPCAAAAPRDSNDGRGSWQDVALDTVDNRVLFAQQGLSIDLGGIAKGYALGLAAEALQDAGVGSAFLHGGGSAIIAIGSEAHADEAGRGGWPVRLGDERGPVVHLRDGVLGVAGVVAGTDDASAMTPIDRQHVTDPRTGVAAAGAEMAACAMTFDHAGPAGRIALASAQTDAWATALLVLGSPPSDTLPCAVRRDGRWTPMNGMTLGSETADGERPTND